MSILSIAHFGFTVWYSAMLLVVLGREHQKYYGGTNVGTIIAHVYVGAVVITSAFFPELLTDVIRRF